MKVTCMPGSGYLIKDENGNERFIKDGEAQLLSSAADLLSACKIAVDLLLDYANHTGIKKAEVDEIKRIILKAEGKDTNEKEDPKEKNTTGAF